MVKTYSDVLLRQSIRQRIEHAQKQGRYDAVARLTVKLENTNSEEGK
ncbi:hypothetical protein SEA_GIANTSBANE_48 [Arthrobacter phage Giantsbane]|nr:hypothetical protein SEA_GIANTSBANE_48 [Arthrobacter phage Giantsbane]